MRMAYAHRMGRPTRGIRPRDCQRVGRAVGLPREDVSVDERSNVTEPWPEPDEDDLQSPDEDAAAITHLRGRLSHYLQRPSEDEHSNGAITDLPTDGEWGYLRCQVVRQKDPNRVVVRLPNGSETTIEARHLLRQAVRFGPAPHRKDERLVIGDIYEDCAYHPVLCTSVDYDEDLIEGISLIDGSEPRGCSLTHCGVVRLSVAEVIRRRDTRATPPMDLRTE